MSAEGQREFRARDRAEVEEDHRVAVGDGRGSPTDVGRNKLIVLVASVGACTAAAAVGAVPAQPRASNVVGVFVRSQRSRSIA